MLTQEYEVRKQARSEGRRYMNPVVLQYHVEHVPEPLRLKVENWGRCVRGCVC